MVILPVPSLPSSAQAGSFHVVGSGPGAANSELWFYKGTSSGWVQLA